MLHLWQGLGYYHRTRHLHQASQLIVRDHGGRFPEDPDVIRSLPGLGRYTANAIACFAFNKRLPIIEANTPTLVEADCFFWESPQASRSKRCCGISARPVAGSRLCGL